MVGMAPAEGVSFAGRVELFDGELANRFEHPVAAAVTDADQTLVHERRERVELRLADLLDRRERGAAGKDGETAEQRLLVVAEEVVAPLDRCAQRPLAFWCVAR